MDRDFAIALCVLTFFDMTSMNTTFRQDQSDAGEQECRSGEMSVDGSLIEKESPPQYVTQRKAVSSSEIQELRGEFRSMVSTMEKWFSRQDENFSKMIGDFNDMKASIKFVSDGYEDLKTQTGAITQRVAKLEHQSPGIHDNASRIAELQAKLDLMDQQARQCNAEVGNLPEKRGENLVALLENIADLVKIPINQQDIVAVHRVPQANSGSPRPKNIVVKFSSRMLRDNFLAAVRLHKGMTTEQLGVSGPTHKIYINEHLTLKNKDLFRQAREAAKQRGFRFVWVKHGSILARQHEKSAVFSVRSEQDLARFLLPNK